MKYLRPALGGVLVLAAMCLPAALAQRPPAPVASLSGAAHDPLIDTAYEHFYNLDYERSTQEFEKYLDKHPNDPFAVNHLLTAVLMSELYRTGAMNSGEYANDSFIGQVHHPVDPKVKDRIKQLVERAEGLEEEQ